MRPEQVVAALLWAVLVLYLGYCWLNPVRRRKPQTIDHAPPMVLYPYHFKFGYDPYNTVNVLTVYELCVMSGCTEIWDVRRYNKT